MKRRIAFLFALFFLSAQAMDPEKQELEKLPLVATTPSALEAGPTDLLGRLKHSAAHDGRRLIGLQEALGLDPGQHPLVQKNHEEVKKTFKRWANNDIILAMGCCNHLSNYRNHDIYALLNDAERGELDKLSRPNIRAARRRGRAFRGALGLAGAGALGYMVWVLQAAVLGTVPY